MYFRECRYTKHLITFSTLFIHFSIMLIRHVENMLSETSKILESKKIPDSNHAEL